MLILFLLGTFNHTIKTLFILLFNELILVCKDFSFRIRVELYKNKTEYL